MQQLGAPVHLMQHLAPVPRAPVQPSPHLALAGVPAPRPPSRPSRDHASSHCQCTPPLSACPRSWSTTPSCSAQQPAGSAPQRLRRSHHVARSQPHSLQLWPCPSALAQPPTQQHPQQAQQHPPSRQQRAQRITCKAAVHSSISSQTEGYSPLPEKASQGVPEHPTLPPPAPFSSTLSSPADHHTHNTHGSKDTSSGQHTAADSDSALRQQETVTTESNSLDEVDEEEQSDAEVVGGQANRLELVRQWVTLARSEGPLEPGLYIVPTPIGNLEDVTLRSLRVLASASAILAEDTRHSRKLLNYYGIRAEVVSCHEHNEHNRIPVVLQRIAQGEALALISDAGTPGISDPGQQIVSAAVSAGLPVIPLPGACAFVTALVASGLDTTNFQFVGFLPPKQGARRARLEGLRHASSTLVFYAPPHGVKAVLTDMVAVLGAARRVCVGRELTKRHEEFIRTDLQGAVDLFTTRQPRGEFVVIVEGSTTPTTTAMSTGSSVLSDAEAAQQAGSPPVHLATLEEKLAEARRLIQLMVADGWSRKDAAKEAAQKLGLKKKDLYGLAAGMDAKYLE